MVLKSITLVVFVVVLLVKYITLTHISKLHKRELKLNNECQEHQGRQNVLIEERKAAEHEESDLRVRKAKLEINLDDLQSELQEQEERNQGLQDRITDQ